MSAEHTFREAFERLKQGKPEVLSKGSEVSQNNVAREAGKDPSALRKQRFPELVNDIQVYVANQTANREPSAADIKKKKQRRNRSLREQLIDVKRERDIALSQLVEADVFILELQNEVNSLRSKLQDQSHQSEGRRKPKLAQ